MSNPWEKVSLSIYESHMKLDNVKQLQTLNEIMRGQLNNFPVETICILGVAGGNGLEHINPEKIQKAYGVDVNENYLSACAERYPELKNTLTLLNLDLGAANTTLPDSELVVANLLIEYIGLPAFTRLLNNDKIHYVSCVIQKNRGCDFVSESPYLDKLQDVASIHLDIEENTLEASMRAAGFGGIGQESTTLPNGKQFIRMDFQRGA